MLLLLFFWVVSALVIGIAVAAPSPHGMSGFVYASFFLGIIGGVGYALLYYVLFPAGASKFAPLSSGLMGASFGVISFPVSTLVAEHRLYVPHDKFQVILFFYLCAIGFLLGWLAARFIIGNSVEARS